MQQNLNSYIVEIPITGYVRYEVLATSEWRAKNQATQRVVLGDFHGRSVQDLRVTNQAEV